MFPEGVRKLTIRALTQPLEPQLYVVAGPIGNLADIGLRALDVLRRAELVACEDTRVTGKLLKAHGIDRPLVSYHEYNAERVRPRLIEALQSGKSVALISDAGTPLVSDPGYKLVRACVDAALPVTAVPGPSAVLAALCVSGLPSDRFYFAGFLPSRSAGRRRALAALQAIQGTLIFFEAPQRLAESLSDMAEILGASRAAAIARELTKLHEEVRRGELAELAKSVASEPPPKGEVVVLVGSLQPAAARAEAAARVDGLLRRALASGSSLRDAAALVASETGLPRREVYRRALFMQQKEE